MLRGGEDRPLVTVREMLPVLGWSLLMAGIVAAPYVWAIVNAPEDHQFGGFIWGVDDGNVYLSWIRQAAEGRLLLANQYTTAPQDPHFFNIFLQALGRAAAWSGADPGVVFHVARLLGVFALLSAIYLLAAYVTESVFARWATLCLASLGSGFGWLAALLAETVPAPLPPPLRPPDYAPLPPQTWQEQPEAVTFLSLLLNPLFVWSMAFLCLVMITAALAIERRSLRWAAVAGVLLLVMGNMHTYDVFVVHGTVGLFAIALIAMRRARLRDALACYAVIFVIGLPAPAWAWWASRQDPAYLEKVKTLTLSPPPLDMAAGYGFILLLAILGAWWAIGKRQERPRLLLPICWVVANAILLYAPVSFQRKLAEGLHMPLCLLAGLALVMVIAPRMARPLGRPADVRGAAPVGQRLRAAGMATAPSRSQVVLLIVLAVAVTMPSNVLFVDKALHNIATNNTELLPYLQPPIYLTFDEVRGMNYLGRESSFEDVVLSSSLIGNYIPSRAPCRVFAGHWAETLGFQREVLPIAHRFFQPGHSARVLRGALEAIGADYVFYGPLEAMMARALASHGREIEDPRELFRATTSDFLEEAYVSGDVSIFKFSPREGRLPPSVFERPATEIPPLRGVE